MTTKIEQREANEVELWAASPKLLLAHAQQIRANAQEADDKATGGVGADDGSQLPALGDELKKAGFGGWSDVASTIYNFAQHSSGFDPSSKDFSGPGFTTFQNVFSTSPFWVGQEFAINWREASITSKDFSQAVGAVAGLVEGLISPVGYTNIVNSIKQIAELAMKNKKETQKESLFSQSSVSVLKGNLYVCWLYAYVEMKYTSGKGYDALQQSLKVVRAYGALRTDYCNRNAAWIIQQDKKSLDDWLGQFPGNDEPPNPNPGWPD